MDKSKNIKDHVTRKAHPVRILQFGEGNFLRGFTDQMIDVANEKGITDIGIVMVKPRRGRLNPSFSEQECMYTVSLRGLTDKGAAVEERVITSVLDAVSAYDDYDRFIEYGTSDDLRFIVSNTTEAGIVFDENDRFDMCPPESFPGKLLKLLYTRYKHFDGDREKGLIILPVELIDDNATVLKDCMKRLALVWELEDGFLRWLDEACYFCNTLVDRIISGFPADEADGLWEKWGYRDALTVCGELFGLWVIEGNDRVVEELPLDKAGLPVKYVDDIKPYKKRKVRILNGAHTAFSLWAYLKGHDIVLDAMKDPEIENYVVKFLEEEVIPTIELDREELKRFAIDVLNRFRNPYIKHELSSIALNSVAKWKTRELPTMLDNTANKKELPYCILKSLAALLLYYRGYTDERGIYVGKRYINDEYNVYEIKDSIEVIGFLKEQEKNDSIAYINGMLSNKSFWGMDLTETEGLKEAVTDLYRELSLNLNHKEDKL